MIVLRVHVVYTIDITPVAGATSVAKATRPLESPAPTSSKSTQTSN